MPPRATGTIEEHVHADGVTVSFRARVRAYGQRHRVVFGTNREGWSRQRAENELERIHDQIERGTWVPPDRKKPAAAGPAAAAVQADETFHVYASRWYADKRLELTEKGRTDYRWRLGHLLRHLAQTEVRAFTTRSVDRYRAALLRENEALEDARRAARQAGERLPRRRPLGPRSINMTLDLLAEILDDAVEDGLLDANPARGKKRRMKPAPRAKGALDPDMVVDVLDAAREWERAADARGRYGAAAFLATLCLAGPRINELTEASRARLDIHGGRLELGKKTEAGIDRQVELTAYLADELRAHLAATPDRLRARPELPLFPTGTGGQINDSNIRNRLLADIVPVVNARREADGRVLLPASVTPHTFRRTFATLALTAGRDPRFVMAQLGHTDARFTLSVYAQVLQRQRVDYELVWKLMRFPDEPERWADRGRAAPPRLTTQDVVDAR